MWDYESDAPFMWPKKQKYPTRRGGARASSTAIPRRRRSAGKWGDLDFLQRRLEAQPAAQGHPVRRLPRPRLELPRRLQARPQGQPARQATATSSRDDDPEKFEQGGAPARRSTSTSACTASTATSRRTCTATATSTARWPRRSRSTATTATAPSTSYPTLRTSGPAAPPGRHGPVAAAHPGRPPALRVARRQALPALARRPEARVGGVAGEGHGHARQPEVQREGGAREAHVRRGRRAAQGKWGAGRDRARARNDKMACYTCHPRGPRAAAAATCRSRPTGRPSGTTTRAARRATSRPTTRRWRATTCSSSACTAPVKGAQHRAGALVARRWCSPRPTPTASASTSSSRRSRRAASRSQAFAPHFPHTVRKTETKTCTDCHVSAADDNNAIMAQLLLLGTNFVNFVGFNAWVGEERRRRGGAGHRVGRAAGGDRQLPAPLRLPRLLRGAPEARSCACPRRTTTARAARCGCLAAARRVPLRRRGRGRLARLRRRQHRQQGRLGAHRHGAVLARSATTRTSPRSDATCVALPTNQPINPARNAGRPDARARTRSSRCTRSTATPSSPTRGRPDPGQRRHARRRRAAQQLPRARADLESRTACSTARAT